MQLKYYLDTTKTLLKYYLDTTKILVKQSCLRRPLMAISQMGKSSRRMNGVMDVCLSVHHVRHVHQ